ncbi:MAG: DNA recombination protein RmuC [candidate division WOR-3 bacterium]
MPLVVTIIITILSLLIALVVILLVLTRLKKPPATETTLLFQQLEALRQEQARALEANNQLLNQRLSEVSRTLADNTSTLNTRLDSAAKITGELNLRLGELARAAENIFQVGKDIASLQEILRAPKPRGLLGELFLDNILKEIVPNNYQSQYQFRSGEKVDAVVRLGEKLVPVDAKFPLEDFQRVLAAEDETTRASMRRQFLQKVKGHIDAIAKKYILPDEGTFDFALMYIPAENVYYETITSIGEKDETILNYAFARRVIPVSPGTIYAYLQAIALGLRGMQIDRKAREILDHLSRLQGDLNRFKEKFETLGSHLTNARNRYDDAARELDRLSERMVLKLEETNPGSTGQED